jgi:maestro heat-like repeat-containing protein family member 1
MGNVLEAAREQLSEKVGHMAVKFCAHEMTASSEVKKDWQTPASANLVLLSVVFPDLVIDEVLKHFRAGDIPHYFVVRTLGDVAAVAGVAFTLRMQEVLQRMIPVIGGVQKDHLKWVFAAALGRFAEAVQFFHSNATDEQKLQIVAGSFESDFGSAFDVVFTKWLLSKAAKVRFAVVESLGYMMHRLSTQAFETNLQRLVPTYLAMYKKEKASEHLPISQGLTSTLEAALERKSERLELLLPSLLSGLHPLVCRPIDVMNPSTIKCQNELLRHFELMARYNLDGVLTFVVNRFPLKEPRPIHGSLLVLRHVVNALDEELTTNDKKAWILSSVQSLVSEPDLMLRKDLLQLIVGLANQGYFAFHGSDVLVHFIARQASISDDTIKRFESKSKNADVSPAQLRNAANHILHVLTTKVDNTHTVLWPYLLELIASPDHSAAFVVVCQCIADLVAIKAENKEQVHVNFDVNPNLPTPQVILARLMVMVTMPFQRRGLGVAVIDCMGALGSTIHPAIGEYWADHIPALREHLEAHSEDDLNIAKWQDILLKMFRETVSVVGPGQWLRDLTNALSDAFALYKGDADLKRTVFRYMGALLTQLSSRDIVSTKLSLMIKAVDHRSDTERQGCAQGLGLAASAHLDSVLPKITSHLEEVSKKKKTGLFSFGSSKPSKEHDPHKSTLALAYGYVCAYADVGLMTARLETHILHNLLPVLRGALTNALKENVIKTIDLIGKAMHERRLPSGSNFVVKDRNTLIGGLVHYLGGRMSEHKASSNAPRAKPTHEIRVLALNALSTLVLLRPAVDSELRSVILDTILPFYELPFEDNGDESAESQADLVFENLNGVLSSMIQADMSMATLLTTLQRLEYYVVSKRPIERERALTSYLVVLKKFVSRINTDGARTDEKELSHLGHYVATLFPRVSDPYSSIRQLAVENLQALFYANQLAINPDDPSPQEEVKLLTEIRDRLEEDGLDACMPVLNDLSSIVSTLLVPDELSRCLQSMLSGLGDSEHDAAEGNAELFKLLIKRRANELEPMLKELINGMVSALGAVIDPVGRRTIDGFRILTKAHFKKATDVLLEQQLPLCKEVVLLFRSLADEASGDMAVETLKRLRDVLNDTPLNEEKATPTVVAATTGLASILVLQSVRDLVAQPAYYTPVLCTLLMRVGTSAGIGDGTSSDGAVRALQAFFGTEEDIPISDAMDEHDTWSKMESSDCSEGIAEAARCIFEHNPSQELKENMISYFGDFMSNRRAFGQRHAAAAVLAEMTNHCGDHSELLSKLIKLQLPRVADQKDEVRKQALIGFGNLESVWSTEVGVMASAVLSSLTTASEDKCASVASTAVASLTRIVRVVDELMILPMLLNICYRLRPVFDRKEVEVRAAAFKLFGELTRFGENKSNNFMDEVHSVIAVFVCHMNDKDEAVQEACHEAFKRIAGIINVDKLTAVINDAETGPSSFDRFATQIAPVLVELFPDRVVSYLDACVDYFKSHWHEIHANAVVFACQLLSVCPEDVRTRLNVRTLCADITKQLTKNSALVRSKTAKGLSLLTQL